MHLACVFRLLSLLVLALAGALMAVPAWAQGGEEVFQVSRVPVDVTAETAAAARETALANGHREAYRRLMRRLVVAEDMPYVPDLSDRQIAQLVQDFSVTNEKTSAVRYLANLTFRFKPEAVRNLFRAHRLRFTETRGGALVVLPVFGPAGEALLWEETNPWASAWVERDFSEALVPIVVPLGDLGDVAAIDAGRALAGDGAALAAIADRYGAEGVLVAHAVLEERPLEGLVRLEVSAERHIEDPGWTMRESFEQPAPGETETLLAGAVDAVAERVQADWKARHHLSFDQQRMVSAMVPITRLADWLEVERRLGEVSAVLGVELVYISRQSAQVDIAFIGDKDSLTRALAQQNLALAPGAAAGWELRLNAPPAQAPASSSEPDAPPGEGAGPSLPPVGEGGDILGDSLPSQDLLVGE